MTKSSGGGISKENLVEVNAEDFRIKSQIPFDCFIYLEKTDKVVHWIRAGAVFTVDHKIKLEKFSGAKVMIFRFQQDQYVEYSNPNGQVTQSVSDQLADSGTVKVDQRAGDAPAGLGATSVTGGAPEKVGSILVQGGAPEAEQAIHVRGGANSKVFGKIVRNAPQPEDASGAAQAQAAAKSSQSGGAQPRLKVDAGFLNIIIMSTQTAFKEVCNIDTQFHAPTKRNVNGKSPIRFDVASLISLSSMTIRGAIALCFPEKTFKGVMEHTAGIRAEEADGDLFLGSGELINFIYEIALPQMITQGYQIQQAVPIFFHGSDLPLSQIMPYPGFSIVFNSQYGPFVFDIGIKTGG